jgi:hypothetical protein
LIDLQVPLLAAKALLLLLLFAFVYVVVRRAVGDLRSLPRNSDTFVAGGGREAVVDSGSEPVFVVEDSESLAPGTRFAIGGGVTVIGRSGSSDIALRHDDYASGEHARLMRRGGVLYIEDMNSTNGTFINGERCTGASALQPGDLVKIGSTTFRYKE